MTAIPSERSLFTTKYENFQRQQEELVSMIRQHKDTLRQLEIVGATDNLERLEERVAVHTFRVLVLGEFKRGKSTFINALLGEEVLPAYEIPCTALINEVKWGASRRALLHVKNLAGGASTVTEIPIDKIVDYATIQDFSRKEREIKESPYEKIELFWPLKLCDNGVELIDSPGLNESSVRERITLDYLAVADAVLFVMSAEALGPSISEDNTIELVRAAGHEDIFFIVNRFDLLRSAGQETVRKHGFAQFGPRTEHGESRVFFISAYQALQGRLTGDRSLVEQSNMLPVERALETFLTSDRGKVKLLTGAKDLNASIRRARQYIYDGERMLDTSVDTLEAHYAAVQGPLRQLEFDHQRIVSRIELTRLDSIQRVGIKMSTFYRMAAEKVNAWLEPYEIQSSVGTRDLVFHREEVAERVFLEVTEYLHQRLEAEALEWQKENLQPLLTELFDGLRHELDERVQRFLDELDAVRGLLASSAPSPSGAGPKVERITAVDRLLSAGVGILTSDLGLAALGAIGGYHELLRSLVPCLVLYAAVAVVSTANPIAMLAAMVATTWWRTLRASERVKQTIKAGVAEEYTRYLRENSAEEGHKIGEQVGEKFTQLRDAVDRAMAQQLQTIRKQVEATLKEKHKGEREVELKLKQLAAARARLDEGEGQLDDFISQVAVG